MRRFPVEAAARRHAGTFLRVRFRLKGEEQHNSTAEQLEEIAAVRSEAVGRSAAQLIAFEFNLVGFGSAFRCQAWTASFDMRAASRTASTMRGYVPQRQMCPSSSRAISASLGLGFFLSSATLPTIMPGVQ